MPMFGAGSPGLGTRLMGALNEGIADLAGGPVDLMNAGMRYLGAPTSDTPVFGSKFIANGLHSVGIGQTGPQYAPQSTAERYGQALARGVGQVAIPSEAMFGAGAKIAGAVPRMFAAGRQAQAVDAAVAAAKIGPFGPIHADVAGDWPAAYARLQQYGGEVPGAINHPELGSIDVPWGYRGDGPNFKGGYGLAKIAAKHPEVAANLPKIVEGLPVVQTPEQTGNNMFVLSDGTRRAVVAPDYLRDPKRWLVTAYDSGTPGAADGRLAGTSGSEGSPIPGGTALIPPPPDGSNP